MRHTLGRQVLFGYAASLIATILIVLVATGALRAVSTVKDEVIEVDAQLVIDAHELKAELLHASLQVRAYLLSGDDRWLAEADALQGRVDDVLADLDRPGLSSEGRQILDTIGTETSAYFAASDEVVQARRTGTRGDELGELTNEVLAPLRQDLVVSIDEFVDRQERRIDDAQDEAARQERVAMWLLWLLGAAAVILAFGVAGWVTRRVSSRLSTLAGSIGAAAEELLASTSQHVAGASEQASAVQQTVATTDELTQSAEETARRATQVAADAQRSADTAESGRAAVGHSVDGMADLQQQVEAIAEGILTLAERAQAISAITQTVRDLADQTNILALNASIEAARAGDEGRGFAVVAAEVRALAEESQRATDQVAAILGEIQQATNQAVMSTEEGTRRVAEGRTRIETAGSTIDELAATIQTAASSAEQIAASAGQQAGATTQIGQAMRDVNAVVEQGLAAARQSERTAKELNEVATNLRALAGVE